MAPAKWAQFPVATVSPQCSLHPPLYTHTLLARERVYKQQLLLLLASPINSTARSKTGYTRLHSNTSNSSNNNKQQQQQQTADSNDHFPQIFNPKQEFSTSIIDVIDLNKQFTVGTEKKQKFCLERSYRYKP